MLSASAANWVWIIPALSAGAFFVVFPFRRRLPLAGAPVSIAAIFAGFALFWAALAGFLAEGESAASVRWLSIGDTVIRWGAAVDSISVTMLGLVTFAALLTQVYSLGYMRHGGHWDPGLGRYYAFHSLFAAAMLALVLADNLIFLYIAWELVGLGSYLLIGFWYDRRAAAEAAKKAFVTTRIGDVGLLIGIIMLFRATGTFDISAIIHAAQNGGVSDGTLTVASLLIFMGAMGKSAQIPFHVWLPDAMEGPTPVSALIHAATMVVAGVYLVARMTPLFELAPGVQTTVATVGLITFVFAGTLALVVTDLKRVLAYSTVSHLGLMTLALGAGGVGAAMFHLVAHGAAKAMLFLGAGSVMHAMGDETDIRKMGGLVRKMPITAWTFAIGAASLAGVVPLSGFFSKDEILLVVSEHMHPAFLAFALAGAALSALYMSRATFAAFFGKPKADHSDVRESPAVMTIPLILLAVPAVLVGFLAFGYGGFHGFAAFIEGEGEFHFSAWLGAVSVALSAAGIWAGWAAYASDRISPAALIGRFPIVHRVLVNGYWFDEAYQRAIDRVALAGARLTATFDRVVVNDTAVDGSAETVRLSGLRLKFVQTGKVYNYGAAMALGAVVVAVIWWLAF